MAVLPITVMLPPYVPPKCPPNGCCEEAQGSEALNYRDYGCDEDDVILGTVAYAEVWKVFQAFPKRALIKFRFVTLVEVEELRRKQEARFKS
jgi:hypothetical protein